MPLSSLWLWLLLEDVLSIFVPVPVPTDAGPPAEPCSGLVLHSSSLCSHRLARCCRIWVKEFWKYGFFFVGVPDPPGPSTCSLASSSTFSANPRLLLNEIDLPILRSTKIGDRFFCACSCCWCCRSCICSSMRQISAGSTVSDLASTVCSM
uniref:Putative secreted protein n=1 Tax=Anopheles triannulatus TaxID=58253 RepID=A0A2M4B3A4_9DIPT